MAGVVGFARQRDYVTLLRAAIARLEKPNYAPTRDDCLSVRITQDYFSVFHAVAPKIGALGPLAREVVTLYTRAKGIIEDMTELRQLNKDALDNDLKPTGELRFNLSRAGLLATNKELCALLESVTLRDGPALIHRLEVYSERRRHKRPYRCVTVNGASAGSCSSPRYSADNRSGVSGAGAGDMP